MAKSNIKYVCSTCGETSIKWQGKCPGCQEWNTFSEFIDTPASQKMSKSGITIKPRKINDIKTTEEVRHMSLFLEFDRALGGGIVEDSVNLLSAQPGAGKTTLLTQVAVDFSNRGFKVIYVSGEESESQIKKRVDRVSGEVSDNFYILTEPSINVLESWVNEINPDFVFVDSIQTTYLEELQNSPGSPTQVKESTARLIKIAKSRNKKCSVNIISQINKKEEIAGHVSLQHMTDSVLFMESENYEQMKVLKTQKNRFGEQEIALFTMDEKGMKEISDPSVYFATQRELPVAGTALTVARNASRNIVIEIESLVSMSYVGFPARKGVGVKREIVDIITEILEQKAKMNFSNRNVTVMTTGGFKVTETAVNLAVAMSIISSYFSVPLPEKTAYIGELSLTGEIKSVVGLESRIKELHRLGYKEVYIPKNSGIDTNKFSSLKINEVGIISELAKKIKDASKE